jgi:tetratricopeptide (TPR) repeat protein
VKAVIAAIHWVAAEGARVVNLSLGFRGEAAEFEDLCRTVRQYPKVFFAAASGNFGPNVKVYPAACAGENIMAVGEVRDGMPTPHSGAGEIYASSDQSFVWPWQYHLDLGRTAAQAGKYQEAREQFKRSLGDERNVQALFQLALLDIHAGNPSQAYKRLQEAVKLECNLPILHTHLGAVRYLQGQYKEAEAHLRDALAIDGNDQMANFNLGQTLFQMGRADEALATYQRVREVNPNYPRLDIAIAEAQSRVGKGKGE